MPKPVAAPAVVATPGATYAAPAPVTETGGVDPVVTPMTPPPPVEPVTVPVSTLPRAGFWIRTGALLIVVFITSMMYRSHGPDGPQGLLLGLAVYGAVMWKLKGTTIGGIVCGLKVVRIDGRPVDWPTAVVRSLSCFLSFVVVGLGFLGVIIDDDKQSWHDKIAGTTVVKVPKGMALV